MEVPGAVPQALQNICVVSRKATDKGRVVHEVRCDVLGALLECSGIMREPCQSTAGCNYHAVR